MHKFGRCSFVEQLIWIAPVRTEYSSDEVMQHPDSPRCNDREWARR
jgi:hypothetical protein